MRGRLGLGLCTLLAGCAPRPVQPETAPPPAVREPADDLGAAAAMITAARMRDHIAFLASDDLRGRDTPSPGLETAARYLADQFAASGLEPAGDAGSYLQRWTYEAYRMNRARVGLELEAPKGSVTRLEYGSDFFAVPAREDGVEGEPIFVGRLDDSPASLPDGASGRIGILHLPVTGTFSPVFGFIERAADAGMRGLVFVFPPQVPGQVIGQIASQLEGGVVAPRRIPTFGVSHAAILRLLAAAGLDAAAFLGDSAAVGTVAAGLTLRLAEGGERSLAEPPNVVAVLRGSDPELRETYVVYSAHFDHLGVGKPDASGDSIYNGADDDASGTSVLLEVARAFAALPEPPRRSLLFLAVSGEEKGLLGSAAFAEHPTVPLDRIVADINLDMIGRNAPDTVIGIGQEYSSLGPVAAAIGRDRPDVGLTVAPDPDPSEQAFFRSDHVNFVRHGIPALFLTAWLHDDYHRPGDEVDLIDADKAARVARLAFYVGAAVAQNPAPPTWNEGSLEEVRRVLGAGR